MPTIEHSVLSGSDLHEPKGYTLTGRIADVSTAETIYIPVPYAGTVVKVVTALHGAITVADSTLTVTGSSGAMGTITVAFTGSAAGTVDTLTPASNETVATNSVISVATDGASTDVAALTVTIYVERT